MIGILMAAVLSATPISLDEVRAQSRQNTQALLAELERQRADEQVRAVRGGLLPQLSLQFGASATAQGQQRFTQQVPVLGPGGEVVYEERTEDLAASNRSYFDFAATLSQLVYDARRWGQLTEAGAQAQAAAAQTDEERLVSEFEGVRRFYELYRSQQALGVVAERALGSESLLARAQALFEAGRRPKDDVIAAGVNLGNDRMAALRQRSRIAQAQAELAVWLARPGTLDLVAVDPGLAELPTEPPPLDEALSQARRLRPRLLALSRQLEASEAAVGTARADYLPQLSVFGRYSRGGPDADPFFTDLTRQNAASAGLSLSWNLFSGLTTSAQVRAAEHQRSRARLSLEQAERELEGEVSSQLAALRQLREIASLAGENRRLARTGLELAEARFATGSGSILEVRDAQVKVSEAELASLEARVDVEIARAGLLRAIGVTEQGAQP